MVIVRRTRKDGATPKKNTSPASGRSPKRTSSKFTSAKRPARDAQKSGQEAFSSFKKPVKNRERKVLSPKRFSHENAKTGHESEEIRLNRYLANAGICSRREADEYIKAGLVTVNGHLVTEMGVKIKPGDEVKYNGEALREEKKVYILLNKPKDYVTTVEDPHAKRTVLDLIKGACKERVYPVGRLDRNTTGVLLLTNDGDLTKKLTHPRYEKLKIYHVHLNKGLKHADLEKIATGVHLEDGMIRADAINYADPADKSQVGIEIHSGRNHIVRRIFESLGYEVAKLDRVYFAGLTKKNLSRGEWRLLSEKEINLLKMNAYK